VNNLKEKAKTPFEIWQQTVEEALKNLPKAFNTGELSDEISKIRKRKEWIKFVDAQKEIEQLKHSGECLRQKLRQIVDNYSLVDDHGVGLVSKRRLEELLKEKIRKTKDNEIRLKVLKIRLDSLLRMPKGRRDETTIEKLREEITEIDEQLKKEAKK